MNMHIPELYMVLTLDPETPGALGNIYTRSLLEYITMPKLSRIYKSSTRSVLKGKSSWPSRDIHDEKLLFSIYNLLNCNI